MKKSGILILFSILLCSHFVLAQEVNVNIMQGFKNGDASKIAPYLDQKVDFIGPNKEGLLSASQAKAELSSFFAVHHVSNFIVKHNGQSPSGNAYSIGVLTTSDGNYRVYMLFPKKTKEKISEIRIEKDE